MGPTLGEAHSPIPAQAASISPEGEAVAQTHGTREMHALVYGSVHCFATYSASRGHVALCATAYRVLYELVPLFKAKEQMAPTPHLLCQSTCI